MFNFSIIADGQTHMHFKDSHRLWYSLHCRYNAIGKNAFLSGLMLGMFKPILGIEPNANTTTKIHTYNTCFSYPHLHLQKNKNKNAPSLNPQ